MNNAIEVFIPTFDRCYLRFLQICFFFFLFFFFFSFLFFFKYGKKKKKKKINSKSHSILQFTTFTASKSTYFSNLIILLMVNDDDDGFEKFYEGLDEGTAPIIDLTETETLQPFGEVNKIKSNRSYEDEQNSDVSDVSSTIVLPSTDMIKESELYEETTSRMAVEKMETCDWKTITTTAVEEEQNPFFGKCRRPTPTETDYPQQYQRRLSMGFSALRRCSLEHKKHQICIIRKPSLITDNRTKEEVIKTSAAKLLELHSIANKLNHSLTVERSAATSAYLMIDGSKSSTPSSLAEAVETISNAGAKEFEIHEKWQAAKNRFTLSHEDSVLWNHHLQTMDSVDAAIHHNRFSQVKAFDNRVRNSTSIVRISERGLEASAKNKMKLKEKFEAEAMQHKHYLEKLELERTKLKEAIDQSYGEKKVSSMNRYLYLSEEVVPSVTSEFQKLLEDEPPQLTKDEERILRGIEAKKRQAAISREQKQEISRNVLKAKREYARNNIDDLKERLVVRAKVSLEFQSSIHFTCSTLILKAEYKALQRAIQDLNRLLSLYIGNDECEDQLIILQWKLSVEEQRVEIDRLLSQVLESRTEDSSLAELEEKERVVHRTMVAEERQNQRVSETAFLENMADIALLSRRVSQVLSPPNAAPPSYWIQPDPSTFDTNNMLPGTWVSALKSSMITSFKNCTPMLQPKKTSLPIGSPTPYYMLDLERTGNTYELLSGISPIVKSAVYNRTFLFSLFVISACGVLSVTDNSPVVVKKLSNDLVVFPSIRKPTCRVSRRNLRTRPREIISSMDDECSDSGCDFVKVSTPKKNTSSSPKKRRRKQIVDEPTSPKVFTQATTFFKDLKTSPRELSSSLTSPVNSDNCRIPSLGLNLSDRQTKVCGIAKKQRILRRRQKALLQDLKDSREERFMK